MRMGAQRFPRCGSMPPAPSPTLRSKRSSPAMTPPLLLVAAAAIATASAAAPASAPCNDFPHLPTLPPRTPLPLSSRPALLPSRSPPAPPFPPAISPSFSFSLSPHLPSCSPPSYASHSPSASCSTAMHTCEGGMRCKAVASKISDNDDQTAETVTMEAMVPMQWLGGDGQPAMKNNRVNSVTRDQQSRSYTKPWPFHIRWQESRTAELVTMEAMTPLIC